MLRRIAQTTLGSRLLQDRGIDPKILLGIDLNIARKELENHGIQDISAQTLQTRTKINASTQQHWLIAQKYTGFSEAGINAKDPIQSANKLTTWRDAIGSVVPDDMPALLKQLKDQSQIIEKLAPSMQQEYGVSQQNTLALVHGVQSALSGTDSKNITAAAAVIVRFDTQLNRGGNITTEQLLETSDQTPAMKDYMENIAQKGDTPTRQEPTETTNQFLSRTAAEAPDQERRIFENGSIVDQAKVLQSILETERVQNMLQKLKDKNEFDLVTDFDALMTDLNNIGDPQAQSICRRSVSEASACVVGYLHRLEDASRTTFFARLVGSLQDLLHIGS